MCIYIYTQWERSTLGPKWVLYGYMDPEGNWVQYVRLKATDVNHTLPMVSSRLLFGLSNTVPHMIRIPETVGTCLLNCRQDQP